MILDLLLLSRNPLPAKFLPIPNRIVLLSRRISFSCAAELLVIRRIGDEGMVAG